MLALKGNKVLWVFLCCCFSSYFKEIQTQPYFYGEWILTGAESEKLESLGL